MRVLLLISIITLTCAVQACAQSRPLMRNNAVVVDATEQHWAGGIAGRAGTYYNFTVETRVGAVLDTVWIGATPYRLEPTDAETVGQADVMCRRKRGEDRWTYFVHVNVDRSGPRVPAPPGEKVPDAPRGPEPPEYSGTALVQFIYDGMRDAVPVRPVRQLEPLSYP